jgi:hypothetical protein
MPRSNDSATERLRQHWSSQGHITSNTGVNPEEIRSFEAHHKVLLPQDFAVYVSKLNGILRSSSDPDSWDEVDSEGFVFDSLSTMSPVQEAPGYYVFCEWVLGFLQYAICLDTSGSHGQVVSVRADLHFLANNFSDFVDLYVINSPRLYEPGSKVVNRSSET